MPVKLISLPEEELEEMKKAAADSKRNFSEFVRWLFAFWLINRKEQK